MASDDLISPVVHEGATFRNPAPDRVARRAHDFGDVLLAIAIGLALFGTLAHGLGVL